jgi:hypothetical protein
MAKDDSENVTATRCTNDERMMENCRPRPKEDADARWDASTCTISSSLKKIASPNISLLSPQFTVANNHTKMATKELNLTVKPRGNHHPLTSHQLTEH